VSWPQYNENISQGTQMTPQMFHVPMTFPGAQMTLLVGGVRRNALTLLLTMT